MMCGALILKTERLKMSSEFHKQTTVFPLLLQPIHSGYMFTLHTTEILPLSRFSVGWSEIGVYRPECLLERGNRKYNEIAIEKHAMIENKAANDPRQWGCNAVFEIMDRNDAEPFLSNALNLRCWVQDAVSPGWRYKRSIGSGDNVPFSMYTLYM